VAHDHHNGRQQQTGAAVAHDASPRLAQLLAPAVEGAGYDLEDVRVSPAGKRRVVRVVVDRDGGPTLDQVAAVSRAVSDVLETAEQDDPELLGGAYVLEVSSPGVDRPLTQARHWRRSTTRLVAASLRDGSTLTGRVLSADDDVVVLEVEGSPRAVQLADLDRGVVQVEFNRPGAQDERDDDQHDDQHDDSDEEAP